jgi:hypothetical protein
MVDVDIGVNGLLGLGPQEGCRPLMLVARVRRP